MGAFAYTGNVQTFTVSAAGSYQITAVGAAGGSGTLDNLVFSGGQSASESGTISLPAGFVLDIVVGEEGTNSTSGGLAGAGGGGTFVYDATPEPTSLALLGVGVAGLATRCRRRR